MTRPLVCVVLAGGLKASPLQAACPISVLDLPLAPGETVMSALLHRVAEVAEAIGQCVETVVVYGPPVPAPREYRAPAGITMRVLEETRRWRGAAGVMRDACEHFLSDADILVLEGARWFGTPLVPLIEQHRRSSSSATVAQLPDDSPAGVYVLSSSTLSLIPTKGFMDFKEQFLARIMSTSGAAKVHGLKSPGSLALRTRADLLAASHAAGGRTKGGSLVDPDAVVDPSAHVLDSVVMAGAHIGEGAILARSIALHGGRLLPWSEVTDAVVGPTAANRIRGVFR